MPTKVSFRLSHPTLDLSDIAKAIGLPIARIWTVGEERRTPKGDSLDGIHKRSYCAFEVVTAEETIPAAIVVIDTMLRGTACSQAMLQVQGLEKSLYCTLLEGGETIDVESLRRLVEWGIRLEID